MILKNIDIVCCLFSGIHNVINFLPEVLHTFILQGEVSVSHSTESTREQLLLLGNVFFLKCLVVYRFSAFFLLSKESLSRAVVNTILLFCRWLYFITWIFQWTINLYGIWIVLVSVKNSFLHFVSIENISWWILKVSLCRPHWKNVCWIIVKQQSTMLGSMNSHWMIFWTTILKKSLLSNFCNV